MPQILPPPTPDPFAYANVKALRSLAETISQIKQGRLRKQAQNVMMQATTQEEAMGGLGGMQESRQAARPTGLGGFVDRFNPMTASYGAIPDDILNQAFRLPTEADIGDQQLDRRYKEARIGATEALARSRNQPKAGKVRTPEQILADIEKTRKAMDDEAKNDIHDAAIIELYGKRLDRLEIEYAETQGMEFYDKSVTIPAKKPWFSRNTPETTVTVEGVRKKRKKITQGPFAAAQERAGRTGKTGAPQADFGNRPDGTKKGDGFLGVLQLPNGDVATEYSTQSNSVKVNGKRIDFPSLVPTLTPEEIELMVNDIIPNNRDVPQNIMQKAVDHARMRLRQGKSVWATTAESKQGAIESQPPPEYPDAAWSEEHGMWTIVREGRLVGVQ